jgi:hypothetical protein
MSTRMRQRRWLRFFHLAAAGSTLLMLLAIAGMVRSWFISDVWQRVAVRPDGHNTYVGAHLIIESVGGRVGYDVLDKTFHARDDVPEMAWLHDSTEVEPGKRRFLGEFIFAGSDRGSKGITYRHAALSVPWWFIALLASVPPAWWLWRWRRERKLPRSRGFEVVAAGVQGRGHQ